MVEVKIGGKKRKFSYGLEVLGWIQVEAGIDLMNPKEGMNDISLFYILIKPVILLGNKWELKKEGKDIDFTYDDVDKWLQDEGMTSEAVLKIWQEYNQSTMNYLPKQDKEDDAPKKK